MVTGSFLEKIL